MIESRIPIDVSIVIVNWNVADLLDGCLRSVEAEVATSMLSTEVIVVDNHSPDTDFRAVVQAHSGARLLELEQNRGYGAACNVGIGIAQGKAVFLLNADTELMPGALDRLWQTLSLNPRIDLVAPLLLNPNGSIQSMGYRFPGPANVFFDLFPAPDRLYESTLNGRNRPGNGQLPVKIDYALGAALFARRAALLDAGLFDEEFFMYSEEIDLQRRLEELGWTRMLAPDARVIHHGGRSTGQRPDQMHVALWESRARYFQRWSTRRERALIRTLVTLGTRLDSLRHPRRRTFNQRIRRLFGRNWNQYR